MGVALSVTGIAEDNNMRVFEMTPELELVDLVRVGTIPLILILTLACLFRNLFGIGSPWCVVPTKLIPLCFSTKVN